MELLTFIDIKLVYSKSMLCVFYCERFEVMAELDIWSSYTKGRNKVENMGVLHLFSTFLVAFALKMVSVALGGPANTLFIGYVMQFFESLLNVAWNFEFKVEKTLYMLIFILFYQEPTVDPKFKSFWVWQPLDLLS